MIKRHGEPKTEEIVKSWVANQPTLINGDTKILEAIAAGQCDVGLTNTTTSPASWPRTRPSRWRAFWANQADDRHPRQRLGRRRHRPREEPRQRHEAPRVPLEPRGAADVRRPRAFEYPANPQAAVNPIVAKWGKFKQDDINIAAAGEFQAAATRSSPTAPATSNAAARRPRASPRPVRPRRPRVDADRAGHRRPLAVPPLAVVSSLIRRPAMWAHLWRTQLVELTLNTLALLAGVGLGTLVARHRAGLARGQLRVPGPRGSSSGRSSCRSPCPRTSSASRCSASSTTPGPCRSPSAQLARPAARRCPIRARTGAWCW